MLGSTTDLVGIDIGQYAIKLARVKKSGKSFLCNFLAYELIPAEIREKKDRSALAGLIRDIIKQYKLIKNTAVIHVHAGDTIMRDIQVDSELRGDMLEGAIEVDLAPALPFGIDQVYFDYEESPNEEGKRLVVAARRDIIDPKTDFFSHLGKNVSMPVQVDVDVFAYERLIEKLQRDGTATESSLMIADISYNRCRFTVFKNQRYVFHREQQIGGQRMNEIFADVYDIDDETAELRKLSQNFGNEYQELVLTPFTAELSEQINLAVDFYEASSPDALPIEKIYLTGGGANTYDLLSKLTETLETQVALLDLSPFIKLQSGQPEVLRTGLSHALAIGLAMEGK